MDLQSFMKIEPSSNVEITLPLTGVSLDCYQTSKKKIVKYVHIHIQASIYSSVKMFTDCLIYWSGGLRWSMKLPNGL